MQPVLGIDFGTTNTSAAWFDASNKLRVVQVADKSAVLPSVVWFPSADATKCLVGQAAKTQLVDDAKHTLFGTKRFLGRRYQSEYVAAHKDRFAFDLVEGSDGYTAALIYGQMIPLVDVAAIVVKDIVARAHRTAGHAFTECVMTVPANASVRQRDAVRRAAEQAGMKVLAMVNEPTAAALFYANLRSPAQTVLIFDLGGGTFDATVLRVENRVVKVLATGGDAFLGGSDFDERLADAFATHLERTSGISVRANRTVMQRLALAAEYAKVQLSRVPSVEVRVPVVAQRADGGFIDLKLTLTRDELDRLVTPLVERCVSACDDVLARAKLSAKDIDELVMVGGQTRMPLIRTRLSHFSRLSSEKDVHPELGVAVGAAILGRNLSRTKSSGLSDVVAMPISVMLPGGRSVEVIAANTPVPCVRSVLLEGLPTWSAPVPLLVFESLDQTAVDREIIGSVHISEEWRTTPDLTPSLELTVGQDFALSAKLLAPGGMQTQLQIVDHRR
ncbi:MAG: Hsp70 family protein [Myxococcales bacterium]|nr:Hsp70 family protein [Myxococcales bacterium]MDP3500549.1 Hsp70 family protein [Myxococcales bacterium]